jgi:hypothetical protein
MFVRTTGAVRSVAMTVRLSSSNLIVPLRYRSASVIRHGLVLRMVGRHVARIVIGVDGRWMVHLVVVGMILFGTVMGTARVGRCRHGVCRVGLLRVLVDTR